MNLFIIQNAQNECIKELESYLSK